jgi:REP element-mobilizing transposase RayT
LDKNTKITGEIIRMTNRRVQESNNKTMPARKPNRLKNYDYSLDGAYFVTICANKHIEIFSRIDEGRIYLTNIGKIIENEIKILSCTYKDVIVDSHITMPNHVHMIIIIYETNKRQNTIGEQQSTSPVTISRIIGQWKRAISIKAGRSIWQKSFHDRIIRNEDEYHMIAEYIDNNPQRWKEDKYYIYGIL